MLFAIICRTSAAYSRGLRDRDGKGQAGYAPLGRCVRDLSYLSIEGCYRILRQPSSISLVCAHSIGGGLEDDRKYMPGQAGIRDDEGVLAGVTRVLAQTRRTGLKVTDLQTGADIEIEQKGHTGEDKPDQGQFTLSKTPQQLRQLFGMVECIRRRQDSQGVAGSADTPL